MPLEPLALEHYALALLWLACGLLLSSLVFCFEYFGGRRPLRTSSIRAQVVAVVNPGLAKRGDNKRERSTADIRITVIRPAQENIITVQVNLMILNSCENLIYIDLIKLARFVNTLLLSRDNSPKAKIEYSSWNEALVKVSYESIFCIFYLQE